MRWRTPAAAALAHARRGWVLVPLYPGTGKAARKWRDLTSTPPGTIAAWWPGPAYNPGILTGPSGLAVVDLDDLAAHASKLPASWAGVTHGSEVLAVLADRAGEKIPATYTVTTPGRGCHLYFTIPPGREIRNSAGSEDRGVGPLVDVRAQGGLIVGAGSVRHDGAYELADDRNPVPLPGWLAGLAGRKPAPPAPVMPRVTVTHDGRGYAAAALRGEADAVRAAARGHRNDQLNRSAFALGQLVAAGHLAESDVTSALTSAAESAGLVADDGMSQVQRTIASGLSAGAAKPRTRRAA